jgi:hypothetical protein
MIEDFFPFATGVNNTGVNNTLSCKYLREFSKKFETALTVYSGAWRKLIHEKTRSRKSRDIVPLRKDSFTCLFAAQINVKYFLDSSVVSTATQKKDAFG